MGRATWASTTDTLTVWATPLEYSGVASNTPLSPLLAMDATKILSREEHAKCVQYLKLMSRTRKNARVNLIIYRLATGVGLRRREIALANLGDVVLTGDRPCLRVRKEVAKSQTITTKAGERLKRMKSRVVPLWWDAETYADLKEWIESRYAEGATKNDPLVCAMRNDVAGKRLTSKEVAKRWRTAIKCLSPDRQRQLHVHCGRHTFASYAIEGHSLVAVAKAMGHSNPRVTSIYLHLVEEIENDMGNLFVA